MNPLCLILESDVRVSHRHLHIDVDLPPGMVNAQMAVAVQRPGANVRCFGEGAFAIELMALRALVEAEPVALVGPPRIDAGVNQRVVLFPLRSGVVAGHAVAIDSPRYRGRQYELMAIQLHDHASLCL